jgi:hypothetical protein
MRTALLSLLSLLLASASAVPVFAQVEARPLGPGVYDLPSAPLTPVGDVAPNAVEIGQALPSGESLGSAPSLSTLRAAPVEAPARSVVGNVGVPAARGERGAAAVGRELSVARRLENAVAAISRPASVTPSLTLSTLFDRSAVLPEFVHAGLGAAESLPSVNDGAAQAQAYEEERQAKAAAANSGKVESLSVIGEELSGRVRSELSTSDTRLVLLDYDDTLAGWAQPLPLEMGAKLRKIMDAQKAGFRVRVGIISDRRESVPEGSKDVSLLMSLGQIPNEVKAGLLVAGSKGARVLELQSDGTGKLVEEEPGWTADEKTKINAALEAVKAKYEADRVSDSEYGWSFIFKPELTKLSQPEQLKIAKEAAALWQAELDKQGLHLEVLGRTAKDPAKNAPYLAISKGKMDKSMGVRHLMHAAGLTDPTKVLVIGDSFFEPNKTDLDMANAAPGARVFSVGGTMDPRVPRGFVYNKKGAEGTAELLDAVAVAAARGAELAGREARERGEQARLLEAKARNLHTLGELSAMIGVIGTVGILWVMFETQSIFLSMLTAASVFGSIYLSKWLEDKADAARKQAKALRP